MKISKLIGLFKYMMSDIIQKNKGGRPKGSPNKSKDEPPKPKKKSGKPLGFLGGGRPKESLGKKTLDYLVEHKDEIPKLIENHTERLANPKTRGRKKGSPANNPMTFIAPKLLTHYEPELLPIIGEDYLRLEPREIMLLAARLSASRGEWKDAAHMASLAAPYYNRRLSSVSIDHTVTHNVRTMTDNELEAFLITSDNKTYDAITNNQHNDPEDNEDQQDDTIEDSG